MLLRETSSWPGEESPCGVLTRVPSEIKKKTCLIN